MSHVPATRVSLIVLASCVVMAVPIAASAETPTCQGRTATIVGPTSGPDTDGTSGDDVVVTTADAYDGPGAIRTGDGDDVVCVVAGDGRTPLSHLDSTFRVATGAGDDTVVIEESRPTSSLFVELGAGADTFLGSSRAEFVYAGAREVSYTSLGADDDRDVIAAGPGRDTVFTGSPDPGAQNDDVVSSGDGEDSLYVGGTGTVLDNGAGTGDVLSIVRARWDQQRVSVDNTTGLASADAGVFMRWSNVKRFDLYVDSPLAFTGSDGPDSVYVSTSVPVGERHTVPVDARLLDGDDKLVFATGPMDGTVDAGDGMDEILLPKCGVVRYRLEANFRCSVRDANGDFVAHTAHLTDAEGRVVVAAGTAALLTGTAGADDIIVNAPRIRLRGLAGNDSLAVSGFGRKGAVLEGGSGRDRLTGSTGRDSLLGGPGSDVLVGRQRPDLLVGGPGRDKASGGLGRDRCLAERRTACETPVP